MKRSPEEQATAADRRERRDQLVALDALAAAQHRTDPTTLDIGGEAEARAIDLLLEHDYEIVERNYRCNVGELDIVAIDGDTLVFVEVRSRADDEHGHAVESISRRKRRLVTRAAEVYLAHRRPDFDELRFDVVAINGDDAELYKDAWRGGLL